MAQVTPIDRIYPARTDAGQVILSTPSVKCSVANDSTTTSAQVVLLRKGEGGDHSILYVFNLTAGPAPAAEAILPNQDVSTEYSVLVLNGTTANIRAYISGVEDTVALGGSATATLQAAGNASLASIDSKLANPMPVSASTLPLPSGAATAAKQDTGNTSIASIDTKTPALVTGRVPVDGSGVTQPVSGTVTVSNLPATQPVSGNVSVSNFPASQAVTGPLTDTQLRATPVPVSGTVTATGPLTDTQLRATPVPVSLSSPLPLPVLALGPLTDTELRATAVPVSVNPPTAGSIPLTTFPAMTTTGSQVWAANSSAKARKIYNRSANSVLYVIYYDGSNNVTSEDTCGFIVNPGQVWEMPSFNGVIEYTGIVRAALATGTGNINATEVT